MDSVKTIDNDDFDDSRHPASDLTLVKVGTPVSSSITIPESGIPTGTTIASLAINTSCFCHPIIRIDFTCNIIIPVLQPNVTLTFQIFRRYNNQTQLIAIGPPWVFAKHPSFTLETIESDKTDKFINLSTKDIICFFVSDPSFDSSRHCGATYTAVVTPNVNRFCSTVTINNATLSAIVSGQRR